MPRPTDAQIDALLNFLEEHRDLAHGLLRTIDGRSVNKRLWDDLCTTLNAMGGCIKTKKQWQKVWTDKKYYTKKAAAAARRSASATGGGPSTAPSLSQWDLKIISIMGDGYGEPQTSAKSQAFYDLSKDDTAGSTTPSQQECPPPPAATPLQHECPPPPAATLSQQESPPPPAATPAQNRSRSPLISTRRRIVSRRRTPPILAGSSVRQKLFGIEERRLAMEEQRNVELAGIKVALLELCGHMKDIKEKFKI